MFAEAVIVLVETRVVGTVDAEGERVRVAVVASVTRSAAAAVVIAACTVFVAVMVSVQSVKLAK